MKYCGDIGFCKTVEMEPGVWSEKVVVKRYRGDITRLSRRTQNTGTVNDSIRLTNVISVVANPFLQENLFCVRFAEFMGVKWKVTDAEVQYPRILLTLGDVYCDAEST